LINPSEYNTIAGSYFDFLAERFPVMCASDEFHFLPRAENACNHYDKLDDVDADAMEETILELKAFQSHFSSLTFEDIDLEVYLDLKLLQANIAGILIELDTKRVWQYNPLLYLKIAFVGLDHALTKPAADPREIQERTLARLSSIPRLLKQATDNIQSVPDTYHQASVWMVQDCQHYLSENAEVISELAANHRKAMLMQVLENTESALKNFARFLNSLSPQPDRRFAVATLESSLQDHFLSQRSPQEIFQIGVHEWHEIREQLHMLQSKIDPHTSWQELYHAYSPSQIEEKEIIALYGEEIDRLRNYFSRLGFNENILSTRLEIDYTPKYLASVRSSASFAAAFSQDPRERSFFYITTRFPRHNSEKTDDQLQKRLHREYKMLTAHETIPGHHFLDSVRRSLKRPIRRQIESPLFYEGWASYAESLLTEYGYLEDPRELLVDRRRNLWRAARCQIDVGLTIGTLTEKDAIDLVTTCGFAPEEASRQLDRFRLNPGYQLCYCYGSYEFRKLRQSYNDIMGSNEFYNFLLEGGELPFHLTEKRFKHLLPKE